MILKSKLNKTLNNSNENKNDADTNRNLRVRNCKQTTGARSRVRGNKRTSGDHTNYSVVGKKSPGNLRFPVTRTPLGDAGIKNSQMCILLLLQIILLLIIILILIIIIMR